MAELTIREKAAIKANTEKLKNLDTDIEDIKRITCSFFRKGGCPGCRGCEQPDEKVYECTDNYLANIETRPMMVWDSSFNKLIVREKVKFGEISTVGMNCNTCYLSDKCPMHKEDSTCAIDFGVSSEYIQPRTGLDMLIGWQLERVNRAKAIELSDGGVPDQNLSTEMDRLVGLYEARAEMDTTRIKISAEAKNVPAGTDEEGQPVQRPSILETLFGGMRNRNLPASPEQKQLDAPPVTINVPAEIITPVAETVKTSEPKTVKVKKNVKSTTNK